MACILCCGVRPRQVAAGPPCDELDGPLEPATVPAAAATAIKAEEAERKEAEPKAAEPKEAEPKDGEPKDDDAKAVAMVLKLVYTNCAVRTTETSLPKDECQLPADTSSTDSVFSQAASDISSNPDGGSPLSISVLAATLPEPPAEGDSNEAAPAVDRAVAKYLVPPPPVRTRTATRLPIPGRSGSPPPEGGRARDRAYADDVGLAATLSSTRRVTQPAAAVASAAPAGRKWTRWMQVLGVFHKTKTLPTGSNTSLDAFLLEPIPESADKEAAAADTGGRTRAQTLPAPASDTLDNFLNLS